MSAGLNTMTLHLRLTSWLCRIILVAYGILMVLSYGLLLGDTDTTIRLVGSDVGCSISAVDCNWFNFTLDKVVGIAVLGTAGAAQFATKWRHRDRAMLAAAVAACVHLVVLQVLLNPS